MVGNALRQMIKTCWNFREMIFQLTKNEIVKRYKGSYAGVLWSLLTPLLMLAIYTFVFSFVFTPRWAVNHSQASSSFALVLFCGLTVFTIFSDVIARSPGLITGNANYVKKIIFPLELLPVSIVGCAVFNSLFGFGVLLAAQFLLQGFIPWTAVFLPAVLLPFILLTMGFCWLISSLAVYLRDIENIVGFALTGLMFMSPVFYPLESIPRKLQWLFFLNPVTYAVEDARNVLLWGNPPNWGIWGLECGAGLLVLLLGYMWFQKIREGFADVM